MFQISMAAGTLLQTTLGEHTTLPSYDVHANLLIYLLLWFLVVDHFSA